MKKLSLSITLLCVLGLFGCSKLKNENPATPQTKVAIHADGFASPTSANFHGKLIVNPATDAKACTECHGSDFNGGSSQQSCNGCHKANHSGGVASPTAANFHGLVIAARNGNTTACQKCHGTDYNGGMSGKSCNACHKHPDGIVTPSSPNFHGKLIAANNWSLAQCKKCHGTDYTGGISGQTCLSCHNKANGPENCTTCHGSSTSPAPPVDLSGNTSPTVRGVGAHQIHLTGGGAFSQLTIQCNTCHVVPASFAAPSHIDISQPYATVRIDTTGTIGGTKTNVVGTAGLAPYAPSLGTFIPNPTYSSATIKCSNTYCHGDFKNGNPTNTPAWNDTSAAACGTCHGDITKTTPGDRALPKTAANGGTHSPATTCFACHADVVDANYKIINPAKHMNGKLNVFGQEIAF